MATVYLARWKTMNENEIEVFTEIGREVLAKGSYGIGWLVSHSPHRFAVYNLISDIKKCDLNSEEKAILIYHSKEIRRVGKKQRGSHRRAGKKQRGNQ